MKIGVFDSGLGGLTVVREIKKLYPDVQIVYLGDTARVPYGTRSRETIIKFSLEGARFLESQGVEMLILACNTASAYAFEEIKKTMNLPVYDVISRGAMEAAKGKKIGVLATKATVRSGAYTREIKKVNPEAEVFEVGAPLLVPLVEEGETESVITRQTVRKYLDKFAGFDMDTLVLGCTHYPYLAKIIAEEAGDKIRLINPAEELAKNLDLSSMNCETGEDKYFLTDITESFLAMGLQGKIEKAEINKI
jgi:glutamate racemase